MKNLLWTGLLGFTATASLTAQDPVAVAIPGPLVPAYTPLPAYGYPIAPVGGGMVAPMPAMPGQPMMYGYPPVGFPAQSLQPRMIAPVAFQSTGATLVTVPMPLPTGTPITNVKIEPTSDTKKDPPPAHFGPRNFIDTTGFYFRRPVPHLEVRE